MISCTVWAGERAISSDVMTDVDAPTMPLNWRTAVALVGEVFVGATFELLVRATFGTARREADPSSVMGLARVRLSSRGALTSMGGSRSGEACCAQAAEICKERTRKLEASRQV